MIGFLDLPVGQVRILGSKDVFANNQANINPVISSITDESQGGIRLATVTLGATEASNITLKPPKDRRWYLLKIVASAAAFLGNASMSFGDIIVDGQELLPVGVGFVALQNFNLFGPMPQQGPNTAPSLDPTYALPIRQQFIISAQLHADTNPTVMDVWIWVWESLTSAPTEAITTIPPIIPQRVNDSWQ